MWADEIIYDLESGLTAVTRTTVAADPASLSTFTEKLVLIIESTATVAALRSDPIIAFFLPLLILLVLRMVHLHKHEPVHIQGECEVEEKVQGIDELTASGVDVDVAGRCPRLPSVLCQ